MPSVYDPDDQEFDCEPKPLDSVPRNYPIRRSQRIQDNKQYHVYKFYNKRSRSVDRKLYPFVHGVIPDYPICEACDARVVPMLDQFGGPKFFMVNDQTLVKDHPLWMNMKPDIYFNDQAIKHVWCENGDCGRSGPGRYWLFKPCQNCVDERDTEYRINGADLREMTNVTHYCDLCHLV